MDKVYIAIDLKSFYASCECVERGADPLDVNLVVADMSRTEKTICLAVSPPLKSYGISGRARLFEVIQRVEEINRERARKAPHGRLTGKSCIRSELDADASLAVDYIVAPPQMAHYMKISAQIYGIYLKYVAPEDIFAYSVDEVFIDATGYLGIYNTDGHGFARMLIQDVLASTGITATAGVGTNMYLCKVAMDIVAKHIPADKDGVRIACLDEQTYKENWWSHTPITDFWRVGKGIASRLDGLGIHTMGDIASWSLDRYHIGRLYKALGKNAELLIDHAWGVEPTNIAAVKAYEPSSSSITSGQVLQEPCNYSRTRLIVWEMADMLSLDLVDKGLVTNQIVLTVGYDRESLADGQFRGELTTDYYGRKIPKHAHGTQNLDKHTSSTRKMTEAALELFDRIIDRQLYARRLSLVACNVIREEDIPESESYEQLSLFDTEETLKSRSDGERALEKERALQEAMLTIKHRFGKNAVLKGKNYTDGATAKERNRQIGGHKA
ncbi:DNA polymerase V [Ruminococcus sp. YRD2003]|uniref:Y-family DNA polymerase n=1 Tax=Ruminococcus sp. YRD2003 TaxID=1452313 RepID=UPI0008B83E4C|nr:DNA polymerase V [Ruminococcus flavefaciens]